MYWTRYETLDLRSQFWDYNNRRLGALALLSLYD
jgi:hypothetical protein